MSNETYTFNAELRTATGTGASRRLRREDKIPAILYGADKEAASLTFEHKVKVFTLTSLLLISLVKKLKLSLKISNVTRSSLKSLTLISNV
jgi:ribosomal protein L25 (general stress protein Ctc)